MIACKSSKCNRRKTLEKNCIRKKACVVLSLNIKESSLQTNVWTTFGTKKNQCIQATSCPEALNLQIKLGRLKLVSSNSANFFSDSHSEQSFLVCS